MMSEKLYKKIFLISDMDGTLLDGTNQVSNKNREALEYFVKNGGLFTVGTGRMERSVKPYLSELPINAPAILYNGAAIYDFQENKVIWSKSLPDDTDKLLEKILSLYSGIGMEIYQGGNVYFIKENKETDQHQKKENFLLKAAAMDQLANPWQKVILAWKPEQLDQVEKYLIENHHSIDYIRSEPQFLELVANGVNKGSALKELINKPDITGRIVIAIGDQLNDIELLRHADIGIAVANAHHDLKGVATYFGDHHDHDAVSKVIDEIEKILDLSNFHEISKEIW